MGAMARRDVFRLRLLGAAFAFALLTQRLAVPVAGAQVPVAFAIYWAIAICLTVRRLSVPSRLATLVLGGALAFVVLSAALCVGRPSLASLAYLLALYLPLALRPTAKIDARQAYRAARFFVDLMTLFGVLALWQFASQRFLHIGYADPFAKLPQAFVMQGYLSSYPVFYGADLYKSNAYVFLEASFLSQFLALAIVVELCYCRRVMPLPILVGALVTTFSGTGVVLLGVACPVLVAMHARSKRALVLMSAAAGVLAAALVSHPEALLRVTEFGQRDTSATARFIEPYAVMLRAVTRHEAALFVGYGPGAADRMVSSADALVNFSAVPKAAIEYGLLGGLPLLGAVVLRIAGSGQPAAIGVALVAMHYFLSGALLQPISLVLLLFFLASGASRPAASPERHALYMGRP